MSDKSIRIIAELLNNEFTPLIGFGAIATLSAHASDVEEIAIQCGVLTEEAQAILAYMNAIDLVLRVSLEQQKVMLEAFSSGQ